MQMYLKYEIDLFTVKCRKKSEIDIKIANTKVGFYVDVNRKLCFKFREMPDDIMYLKYQPQLKVRTTQLRTLETGALGVLRDFVSDVSVFLLINI